jgi:hypothetical protein
MAPLRNRPEDVGGVPDRNHDFRDLESMEAVEGWQRVTNAETAMKPIRNRPEDVGGAVDPNFARRDLDSMDPYVFPPFVFKSCNQPRSDCHCTHERLYTPLG